jgi:signal transduction histidine kinase
MEEIYLDCQPFIEKRSQRLVIEDPGTLPTIRADREKLRDIVENLLLNAIKFTPDGGLVKVGLGKRLDGGVLIAVHDQGLGIPQEEMPRLFQPFYSGSDVLKHSSGTSEYQKRGMGLGLTIVKHFVDLHGGTITVQTGSTGSVFTVSIPAGPGAAQSPVAQDEWMI